MFRRGSCSSALANHCYAVFQCCQTFQYFKGKQQSRFLRKIKNFSMWIKKTSLGLNMGHGFLVFNLYVTYVVEDVKISDARTASSRGCPRFCLVCSLHADAHTLLVPSLGLRPCCLCSSGALWLRPFSHDTSHSLFPPSLSSECTPSAFPALGYWLQLLTVQWFHILFYLFN